MVATGSHDFLRSEFERAFTPHLKPSGKEPGVAFFCG